MNKIIKKIKKNKYKSAIGMLVMAAMTYYYGSENLMDMFEWAMNLLGK